MNFSQAVEVVESSVRSTVRVTACSVDACHERIVTNIKELSVDIAQWPLLWVDVEGLDDVPTIRAIGKLFEIPHLALEDAVTPDERPKVEFFENQAIITVRMVRIDEGTIVTDPVGIIFGSRVVITFRERFTADGFRVVRERFRMHRPQAGALRCRYALFTAPRCGSRRIFPSTGTVWRTTRRSRGKCDQQSRSQVAFSHS